MNIFILIFGLIFLAIAISFLIKHRRLQLDVRAMRTTETSNIATLRAMQSSIAQEMGRNGTWREQVEVKGRVSCRNPLTAELSKYSCVYCHTVIQEEYEKTEYETDDDGDTHRRENRGTKTISNNKNQLNFYLEDQTDKILVNPTGAEIDALTVVNEFIPAHRMVRRDYRILGYHHTEKIIEMESEVYILGEVKDIDGRLQIGGNSDRQQPFIISHRSEGELLQAKTTQGKRKLFWGIGLLIAGGVMTAYSLLAMLI